MDRLDVSREAGVTVVAPRDERLDAQGAPAFKQAVVGLVQGGERRLVIDLEGLSFIDSSGLGALVSVLKALGGDGALAVCNARGAVESLFRLTRMDRVFALEASRAAAIAKVAG